MAAFRGIHKAGFHCIQFNPTGTTQWNHQRTRSPYGHINSFATDVDTCCWCLQRFAEQNFSPMGNVLRVVLSSEVSITAIHNHKYKWDTDSQNLASGFYTRSSLYCIYTVQGNSKYTEHKLQQNGPWKQTLPLSHKRYFAMLHTAYHHFITSMHNSKKAYLLHITLLQWSKKLAEVHCVGHVHTTSATNFKLHLLQMKSQKYVCWQFHCTSTCNLSQTSYSPTAHERNNYLEA